MKALLKQYWIVIAIVAVFILIEIIMLQSHATPYWDAAVYIGAGKYLFSHGTVGTWEALRPVALPIILGLFWKAGVSVTTAGIIVSLLMSSGLIVLAYIVAENIKKGAGDVAALLLATSVTYFTYAAMPVTDIISTFFSMLSLWLVYRAATNKQYFIAGLVAAIGFMFRFPHGLALVVALLMVVTRLFSDLPSLKATARRAKIKWGDAVVAMIERLFAVGGGFCVIAVPFLIVNYYFYHNPFLPFIEGTASITGYPTLYQKGAWFYIVGLLREDFLYILALLPIGLLWQKEYRHKLVIGLTTALVIVGGYFIFYQSHKELRFALAFIPYIAALAAVGILHILEWTKMPRTLFFGLFLIVAFMASIGTLVYARHNPNNESFYAFDTYLQNASKAHVMSSTPFLFATTDVLLTHNLYGDWNDAYYDYNTFRSTNDYIALDSCNLELGCADDNHCADKKQALLTELDAQNTKVFDETTPRFQCRLLIYKIGK